MAVEWLNDSKVVNKTPEYDVEDMTCAHIKFMGESENVCVCVRGRSGDCLFVCLTHFHCKMHM